MACKRPAPALSALPTELLLHIGTCAVLNSLLRASHRFAQLYSPLLFQRALVTIDARNGRSVLHWAIATGRDRLLENLLTAGANGNSLDNHGTTPLDSAVLVESEMTVTRLLESGAAVQHKDNDGQTALHLAVITGNDVVAKLLLQCGADVGAVRTALLGMKPLYYAVMLGHVHMVELLLSHGAHIDMGDLIGSTVAQDAALAGRVEVLELLFGREEAATIVASARVGLLVPLVGVERIVLEWHIRPLVVAEEWAKGFRCTTDRMWQWDLKTIEELVSWFELS